MVTRSRSLQVLTTSQALSSWLGSIRMSSGASAAYEKPRSGRSSCIEETPRSSRIASARTPFPASCGRTTPKSPRRRRAFAVVRFASCSKYVRAVGSRSIAISFPLPRRSAARIAACPPAPKVASMTVSPGATARHARTSSERTGTWSASLGCKTFGNILSTPFDPGEPALRVREQSGRDAHAALLVRRLLARAGEEVAVHPAALLAERMQVGKGGGAGALEGSRRPDEDAAVQAPRDDAAVVEGLPELRRKCEAVLVVDRMLVLA